MIHFQTTNPIIAILPSWKKPTEDPFLEEYERLNAQSNLENNAAEGNSNDAFVNVE